uniref:Uncharacterized protein n=1 Tax=Oryza punctata TaxID=4537 RepID=A0A0E0L036_ORYPU
MAVDWTWARRSWEKWAGKHVGASGKPVKAALLLNYDPKGPSRLLPVVWVSDPHPSPKHGRCLMWPSRGNQRIDAAGGWVIELGIDTVKIAEQEGTELKAVDLQPFLDFVRRNNLQMEFFSIGSNQYLVTSIHEHWFCARCINAIQPEGEGVIVMEIGAYLYDGSLVSASQAMVAADHGKVLQLLDNLVANRDTQSKTKDTHI